MKVKFTIKAPLIKAPLIKAPLKNSFKWNNYLSPKSKFSFGTAYEKRNTKFLKFPKKLLDVFFNIPIKESPQLFQEIKETKLLEEAVRKLAEQDEKTRKFIEEGKNFFQKPGEAGLLHIKGGASLIGEKDGNVPPPHNNDLYANQARQTVKTSKAAVTLGSVFNGYKPTHDKIGGKETPKIRSLSTGMQPKGHDRKPPTSGGYKVSHKSKESGTLLYAVIRNDQNVNIYAIDPKKIVSKLSKEESAILKQRSFRSIDMGRMKRSNSFAIISKNTLGDTELNFGCDGRYLDYIGDQKNQPEAKKAVLKFRDIVRKLGRDSEEEAKKKENMQKPGDIIFVKEGHLHGWSEIIFDGEKHRHLVQFHLEKKETTWEEYCSDRNMEEIESKGTGKKI